jgi:hypothetical protein
MDPAFNQLHMYVCMIIELTDYALTDKTKGVFELCKGSLQNKVNDFPIARDVIGKYIEINSPHELPSELKANSYTDKFVADINAILTECFLQETPEKLVESFYQLTDLTITS